MNLDALYHEHEAYCRAEADPAIVAKYARFFKEGYDAFGVDGKQLQAFHRELIARHAAELTPASCLALGRRAISTGKYEQAALAIALSRHAEPQLTRADLPELEWWLDHGVTNWAIGDVLCSEVLSPLLKRGALTTADLAPWCAAESTWRRRALPVALIPLLKRDKQAAPLLALVEPLMHDAEYKVQQGVGWFLRECWKVDPQPVEALLLKHKATAPRPIYQYAGEKMTAEQKARFKKSK